jgi:dipeptidyl aminopeptidase/acylaminoacyl peptidase
MPTPAAALFFQRLAWLCLLGSGGFANRSSGAASSRDIESIYEPFRVEQASLAPDGEHVAFTLRNARGLDIHIYSTARPGEKAIVPLDRDRNATTRILSWISSEQLVAVTSSPIVIVSDSAGHSRRVDTTNLFRHSDGDKADLQRPAARIFPAPDDPAAVLFETNIEIPVDDGPPPTGLPGRPRLLEMHRLNVLTGEAQRVLDYPVEKETPIGAAIVDRQGNPRMIYRYGAEPPYFAYRDAGAKPSNLGKLGAFFGADGWRELDRVLTDRSTFSFSLAPGKILTERTIPLGFDSDPNILFFASNLRRDTYGIYACDLRTGKRTGLALEEPGTDLVDPDLPWTNPPLIFDRSRGTLAGVNLRTLEPHVRWLDAELEGVQHTLEKKFPLRRIELLDWDGRRERFLALVGSLGDPGRYFVFHRSDGRCVEYLRRAPSLGGNELNPTEAFTFATRDGGQMTGYLTLLRTPGKVLPPVVVSLHDGPWQRAEPGYDRDAQALATMGFAVVKINYRGSAGFGLAHREAIRSSLDRGPIEDVVAALEWLRTRHRIDTRRVGLVGEGYGGYLALRALELQPAIFQSAAVINGLVSPLDLWSGLDPDLGDDTIALAEKLANGEMPKAEFKPPGTRLGSDPVRALARWLVSRQSGLGATAVTSDLKLLTKPVFLLHDPDNREAPFLPISNLRASLRRLNHAPEFQKLSAEFVHADSSERGRAFRRIGEFFNTTLYDFKVKIGEAEEKK